MKDKTAVSGRVEELKKIFSRPARGCFFAAAGNDYFYDADTGDIVTLDPISKGIIGAAGSPALEETMAGLVRRHGTAATASAAGEIVRLATDEKRPLFSCRSPEKVIFYLDLPMVEEQIARNLQHLVISITDACNLDCRYCCYSGKYPQRSQNANHFMSREVLDRSLDYMLSHSENARDVPYIGFYGGEPLLAFDGIRYAVNRVKTRAPGRKISFGLTTNLTALRPEILPFLCEHDFQLYVSLDGPADVHDRYRVTTEGKETHGIVMDNLNKIREYNSEYARRKISFNCTAAPPYRYEEILDFFAGLDLARESNLMVKVNDVNQPQYCFQGQPPEFFAKPEVGALRKNYFARLRKGSADNRKDYRNRLANMIFDMEYIRIYRRNRPAGRLPSLIFPGGICLPGQRKVYARWDGRFFPCERVPEVDILEIGNCDQGVDAGKVFRLCTDFAETGAEECRECWAILICGDLCFRDILVNGKMDAGKKKGVCRFRRARKKQALEEMCETLEENPQAFAHLDEYVLR